MQALNVNSKFLLSTVYAGRVSTKPLLTATINGISMNVAFVKKYYKNHKKSLFFQLIKSNKDYYLLISKIKKECYYTFVPLIYKEKINGFNAINKSIQKILSPEGLTERYLLEEVSTNDKLIRAFKLEKAVTDSVLSKEHTDKNF